MTRINSTSVSKFEEGTGKVLEGATTVAPGPAAVVLSGAVPAGKTWRLRYADLVCRGVGRWSVYVDSTRVGGGATSAAREHDRSIFPVGLVANSGQAVEVRYTYTHGPAGIDLDAFVGVTEN